MRTENSRFLSHVGLWNYWKNRITLKNIWVIIQYVIIRMFSSPIMNYNFSPAELGDNPLERMFIYIEGGWNLNKFPMFYFPVLFAQSLISFPSFPSHIFPFLQSGLLWGYSRRISRATLRIYTTLNPHHAFLLDVYRFMMPIQRPMYLQRKVIRTVTSTF